jgi:hypothetical protein
MRVTVILILGLFIMAAGIVPGWSQPVTDPEITDASDESGTGSFDIKPAIPEELFRANQAFMALRGKQFDAAIQLYGEAANMNSKFQPMVNYSTEIRNDFWAQRRPATNPDITQFKQNTQNPNRPSLTQTPFIQGMGEGGIGEKKIKQNWETGHVVDQWKRVRIKFWLGWFKSSLPQDQMMQQQQYNSMYDPMSQMMGQGQGQGLDPSGNPIGGGLPGAPSLQATEIGNNEF